MFWRKIVLDDYLPFSHCGNRHVSIEFREPACAILGNNGCGKSSLLRALTPYPSVRTEFGPKGKIVKTLDHNGSVYELTSDFSNATAPHSFKKDGVELNVGGTTEVQKDLIYDHFDLSPLVVDLISGKVEICDMSRAERKALFSSLYPSDLSFIVDYHKQVCSQSRACGNQLKLLKQREGSLRSLLVDEDTRDKLTRFKKGATELIDNIDRSVLLLESKLKEYADPEDYYNKCIIVPRNWAPSDITSLILGIRGDLLRTYAKTGIRARLPKNLDVHAVRTYIVTKSTTASNTVQMIKRESDRLAGIRDELDKLYAAKRANDAVSEIPELEARRSARMEELAEVCKKLQADITCVVDASRLETITSEVIPQLKKLLEAIYPDTGHIMTDGDLVNLRVKLDHCRMSVSGDIRNELETISAEMLSVKDKLDRLSSKPYPKDCTQICPLRSAISDNIKATEERWNALASRKADLLKQYCEMQEFINAQGPVYDAQEILHKRVGEITRLLQTNGLDSIAFEGEDPVTVLNTRSSDVLNRILVACETTSLLGRKKELSDEIASIEKTLLTMASSKQLKLSADIINQSIEDRESKLNSGIEEIATLESKLAGTKKEIVTATKVEDHLFELDTLVQDTENYMNARRIEDIKAFLQGLIDDLLLAKHDLSEELFKVSKTLQDQQRYLDILDTEIIPTSEKVKHDKQVFDAVASGLSPTSGLPCVYLTRFINRILAKANAIISEIMLYNMDLVYLKEDEELDFTIQVMFRNSTTVRDISECSNGQKSVVNLAIMLALCMERGFLDRYAICLDEIDAGLIEQHRARLVELINKFLENGVIKQLMLVNHFAIQTGMSKCQSVVLSPEGIIVPQQYNEGCEVW